MLFHVGHKELVLKSTDLEISLQATCSIEDSSFAQTESFLVPGKRLFDIVKELEGAIECTLENQQLLLQAGSVNLGLNIKNPEAFPPFPERIENLMHLEASFFAQLLDKVAFLIPQNNANPSLNGLFLELNADGLTMTTTDGHCLAQIKTKKYTLEEDKRWLLPRRAIFEIKKIIDSSEQQTIFLGVCGNQLVFSGESFNFFTKLLADQFPQYRPILQKDDFVPAILDRSHFIKTLRRSSCLLSGQFLATKFSFDKEMLNVSMENKEVGNLNEQVPLQEFKGQEMAIRFYAPYLLNGLQAFSEKDITCYLKNPTKPIIFQADKEDFQITYLVMPVSPTTN
ncbi:MAG: DNA polymerase III subunit beta [Candidatus Babeliales bacterium]